MSLQAIQQEMEQEAKIDKLINDIAKRFLKKILYCTNKTTS